MNIATNLATIGTIVGAMALVAVVELVIPLHRRGPWHRTHLPPNLALTFITFATNVFLNTALLLFLTWLEARKFGILRWLRIDSPYADVLGVVGLDFSFYVAHVAMHKVPVLWRIHRVHHSDPVVDVTTTIRQHPLEGLIRYAFMSAFACALGVGLGAFVIYRVWSALNGLLEHANIRIPRWLDATLSLVTTWPNMHKVHHSRRPEETDTNYGNIFSWFDRLLSTLLARNDGDVWARWARPSVATDDASSPHLAVRSRMNEEQLLAAIEGNRGRVWALCYRMTGNRADADDLAQDAMTRALERSAQTTADDPTGWLLTLTSHLCLDHLRQRKTRRRLTELIDPLEGPEWTVRAAECSPDNAFVLQEDIRFAIVVALRCLPADSGPLSSFATSMVDRWRRSRRRSTATKTP